MAAEAVPGTSQGYADVSRITKTSQVGRRRLTIREVLMQLECHHYKNLEHRVSLLIAAWKCFSESYSYFHDAQNIFEFIYRESVRSILSGTWMNIDQHYKRGLARAIIQFSQVQDSEVECLATLCSSLVMTVYDPWGDPGLSQIIVKKDINNKQACDFVESEPADVLLIRVECLVAAGLEESAASLCRVCLKSERFSQKTLLNKSRIQNVKQPFMENLLRILFRKGRLNEIVADSSLFTCLDAVVLIRQVQSSQWPESEALTETLVNLFLVRDLLSQSSFCCTKELMQMWCELQIRMQRSVEEVQTGARKLIVSHASNSAHFYVFVDTLWEHYGIALLPLYLELFIRGLTSDLNFLEAARQADARESIMEIENHMATVYFKLSTLFTDVSKEISLECLLSSFSLDPSREKLDLIKTLSLQISVEKSRKSQSSNCILSRSKKSQRSHGWPSAASGVPQRKVSKVMCDRGIQVGESQPFNCSQVKFCRESQTVNAKQPMEDNCPKPHIITNDSVNLPIVNTTDKEIGSILEEMLVECENMCAKNSDFINTDKVITDTNDSFSKLETTISSHECSPKEPPDKESLAVEPENAIENPIIEHIEDCLAVNDNASDEHCDSPVTSVVKVILDCIINVVSGDVRMMVNKCDDHENIDDSAEKKTVLENIDNCLEASNKEVAFVVKGPLMNGHLDDFHETLNDSNRISCKSDDDPMNDFSMTGERKSTENEKMMVSESDLHNKTNFSDSKLPCNGTLVNSHSNESCLPIKSILVHRTTNEEKDPGEVQLIVSKRMDDAMKVIVDDACPSQERNHFRINGEKENTLEVGKSVEDKILQPCRNTQHSNYSFKHVIMDAKIQGVSSELLADFIIVLESLRHQQLRSTSRWTELKEACRDYLDSVSSLRCMFLNTQLNGSVDSGEDSDVTMTANRDLASFKSNSTVRNNSNIDKTVLFRRFVNGETDSKFTTFVTLSDIQHPYLNLDRLLCADVSSSHHDHAKHHRRHKTRDPKKFMLKQLRHSSRYSHDILKRKKKKRRKGRKEKSHNKKHHSTHNKDGRDLVLNKKKRQRTKKKKDLQLDPGEYCSDFSSTELMRIVNEHSNSFSQGGLSYTQKRKPTSSASSIESNSVSHFPSKKKRKQVSFKKLKEKKNSLVKLHEKHKHSKSKRDKKKSMNHSQDYSRIVEFSSVKQMQSVQIRQSSMSLDLSNVNKDGSDNLPNTARAHENGLPQGLSRNALETYSPEDLKKFQILLSANRQSPESRVEQPYDDNVMIASNKQTVLKYVSSKMTSRVLSLAQASNRSFSQKADDNSSPTLMPSTSFSTQDGNYAQQDRNMIPVSACSTSQVVTTPLPSYVTGRTSKSAIQNPVITALTFPVTQTVQSNAGNKVVAGKLVIPLGSCSSISNATVMHGNPNIGGVVVSSGNSVYPASNLIVVKKSNIGPRMMPVAQSIQRVIPAQMSNAAAKAPVGSLSNRKSSAATNRVLPNTARKVVKKYIQPTSSKKITNLSSASAGKQIQQPIKTSSVVQGHQNSESCPVAKPVRKTYKNVKLVASTADKNKEDFVSADADKNAALADGSYTQGVESENLASSVPSNNQSIKEDNFGEQQNATISSIATEAVEGSETEQIGDSEEMIDTAVSGENHISTVTSSEASKDEISNKLAITKETKKQEAREKHSNSFDEEEEEEQIETDHGKDELSNFDGHDNVKGTIAVDENEHDHADIEHDTNSNDQPMSPVSEADSMPASLKSNADDSMERETLSAATATSPELPSQEARAVPSSSITVPVITVSASHEKQLQPLVTISVSSMISANKLDGVSSSDAPTRSLTSISDAVRFSLMDMDDATGAVENQVLQTFHPTFVQEAVAYAGQQASAAVSETSITTLTNSNNLSSTAGASQTFVVGTVQNDSYSECHISGSSTAAEWSTDDLVSNVMATKTMEAEGTAGEQKEEEKVKRKRKKKEKVERDPDAVQRYWCEICHRGFFSAYNLRRHCRNVHKMDLPKGTSDVPFSASSSQCISQVGDRVICSAVAESGTQSSSVGSKSQQEFLLQSPTAEGKSKDFSHQTSPTAHSKQIQQQVAQALNTPSNYALHSPPRSAAQTQTAVQVPAVTPPKDFHLQPSPTPSIGQGQQSSFLPVASSLPKPVPKFQMVQGSHPTTQIAHGIPRMATLHQPAVAAGQSTRVLQPGAALQKPSDIQQQSTIVQPLPCQVQQIQQGVQCPLVQNKEEQRASMLQSAAQEQALRIARHTAEVQQKAMQFSKKSSINQPLAKSDSLQQTPVQMQQVAAANTLQPPILNPQMKKLVQIRQAALGRPPDFALQLPTQTASVDLHAAQMKTQLQYFQPQVSTPQHQSALHSAVRQTLVSCATARQNQANLSYVGQAVQSVSNAEFLSRIVPHSGQERSSCSQTFAGIGAADISLVSGQAHVPIIRQPAEASEGLEDLEQFLLDNMPWGGATSEQIVSQVHSLNRANADAIALASSPIKSIAVGGAQQAKGAQSGRNKQAVTKPKACKPVIPVASKSLPSKCSVKKKVCPKKSVEPPTANLSKSMCAAGGYTDTKQFEHKTPEARGKLNANPATGILASGSVVEENDSHSSDSVQCIEIMHHSGNPKAPRAIVPGVVHKTAAGCKAPGFCSSGTNSAEQVGTQSSMVSTQANLPVSQPSNIHFQPAAAVSGQARSPSNAKDQQHTFRYSDNTSVFLNPPCQDGKSGCVSGQCATPKPTKEPVKPSDSGLGNHLTEDCGQVYPEMPSFYAGALMHNDNVDAEKELRNLQNKISDCEKHLKNSESLEARSNTPNSDKLSENKVTERPAENKLTSPQPHQKNPFLGLKNQDITRIPNDEQNAPGKTNETQQLNFLGEKNLVDSNKINKLDKEQSVHSSLHEPTQNHDQTTENAKVIPDDDNVPPQKQPNSSNHSNSDDGDNSLATNASCPMQQSTVANEKLATGATISDNNHYQNSCPRNKIVSMSESDMPLANAVTISIPDNGDPSPVYSSSSSSNSYFKEAVITTGGSSTNGNDSHKIPKDSEPSYKSVNGNRNYPSESDVTGKDDVDRTSKFASKLEKDSEYSNKSRNNNLHSACDTIRCDETTNKTRQDAEPQINVVAPGRTRLRDTPKTSVKRSCPCCTESCPPKKCRENTGSSGGNNSNNVPLIVSKVSKLNQPKPNSPQRTKVLTPLKTKSASMPSVPVKTRSSHRLRSRNGSVT